MNPHAEVLTPEQQTVLREIGVSAAERGFHLGGGAALGIYLGHRQSVDLDWFTGERIENPLDLAKDLQDRGVGLQVGSAQQKTLHGDVRGVRVSFFEYRRPLLAPPLRQPDLGCTIASLEDLAAMKLLAVAQRGAKKFNLSVLGETPEFPVFFPASIKKAEIGAAFLQEKRQAADTTRGPTAGGPRWLLDHAPTALECPLAGRISGNNDRLADTERLRARAASSIGVALGRPFRAVLSARKGQPTAKVVSSQVSMSGGEPANTTLGRESGKTTLDRWRAGDQQAAGQLYARFAQRLWWLARGQIGERLQRRVDPDDILQSVFRTFFRRTAQGEYAVADTGSIWLLLVRITLRKVSKAVEREQMEKRDPNQEAYDEQGRLAARSPTPDEAAALLDEVRFRLS